MLVKLRTLTTACSDRHGESQPNGGNGVKVSIGDCDSLGLGSIPNYHPISLRSSKVEQGADNAETEERYLPKRPVIKDSP